MAIFTRMKKAGQAHEIAKRVQDENQKTQAEIELLKAKVEKLTLICQGLWEIIGHRLELGNEDLMTKIQELDALYSKDAPPTECISCKRPIHVTKRRCIFCGSDQPEKDFFDSLRG
ncbi:MAG: hypothetical protein KKE17_03320 [Proteobacteria bacterium]|nr:hypothetical protein [Pseudomonadota bacterium]MBU1709014.1 hypothetical protein [Pseudomonadota bacterium]